MKLKFQRPRIFIEFGPAKASAGPASNLHISMRAQISPSKYRTLSSDFDDVLLSEYLLNKRILVTGFILICRTYFSSSW